MTPIFHQEEVMSVNFFLKIIQQMLSLFQQTILALFTPGFTTFQKTLSGAIVMINRQQKKYSPPSTHPSSLLLILKFQGKRQSLLTDIDVLWYLYKHSNTPPTEIPAWACVPSKIILYFTCLGSPVQDRGSEILRNFRKGRL